MLRDMVEVEAIKIAVGNLEGSGISSREVLIKSVTWLREKYELSGEYRYLIKAVWHIYAYLGLGFSYKEGERVDILLCDIELPDTNGIDIGRAAKNFKTERQNTEKKSFKAYGMENYC